MSGNLEQMQILLELKYQRSRAGIAEILRQENRLRAELSKLARQEAESRQTDTDKMKAIGGDVLWQAWLGRMRTHLNRDLALVLAQKEILLKNVRQDFGRLCVIDKLVDNVRREKQSAAAADELEAAIDHAVTHATQR